MRITYSKLVTVALLAPVLIAGASSTSAFAKTKAPQEKFTVTQVGQTPNFTVTNNSKKERIIAIELSLYDSTGREEISQAWDKQVIAPSVSQTYSLGKFFLTPAGSPYHVVASIFSANKKHKLIETIDPAGTFTVVH